MFVGITNKLLEWNRDLSKQGDSRNGSTPLHFAASCGFDQAVISLINADKCSAYRPDNKGSFPIHIANKAYSNTKQIKNKYAGKQLIKLVVARGEI